MLNKATVIGKIFYLKNPHLRHYRFELLQGLSRPAFAEKLARSIAVLYLDEIAGMPTLPLEAMACKTIPVGWRTPGGSEFMTEENGFWVTNGDILALAETLSAVINAYEQQRLNLTRLELGFENTLTLFTEEQERRETLAYFSRLIESLW
jgi:glycosyltransferase involved in cell wall biosynthesis